MRCACTHAHTCGACLHAGLWAMHEAGKNIFGESFLIVGIFLVYALKSLFSDHFFFRGGAILPKGDFYSPFLKTKIIFFPGCYCYSCLKTRTKSLRRDLLLKTKILQPEVDRCGFWNPCHFLFLKNENFYYVWQFLFFFAK